MDERTFVAKLKTVVEGLQDSREALKLIQAYEQKLEDAAENAAGLNKELDKTVKATDKANKSAVSLLKSLQKLQSVGTQLRGIAGDLDNVLGGLGDTLNKGAESYIRAVGRTEQGAARWLDTQKKLEESQVRIGRVASSTLLPALERAAAISENIARFTERYPNVVKGAAVVAGGAAGIIAALYATSKTLEFVSALAEIPEKLAEAGKVLKDVAGGVKAGLQLAAAKAQDSAANKQLAAAAAQNSAANKQAGAAGAQGASALGQGIGGLAKVISQLALVIGPAIGAFALAEVAAKGAGREDLAPVSNLAKVAALAAHGLGGFVGGTQTANEWFTAVAKFTGAVDEATGAALDLANAEAAAAADTRDALDRSPEKAAAVQAYIDFQEESKRQLDEFTKAYKDRVKDQQKEIIDIQREFRDQEAENWREFIEGQAKARKELTDRYNEQLKDLAKSEKREDSERARDRAKELQKLAKEEKEAEEKNGEERLKLIEEFGEDAVKREKDHQKEMRRAQEDLQYQIQDLAEQRDALGIVRAMREAERQRKRREEDYQDEVKSTNEEQAKRLAEMEAQFAIERKARLDDLKERWDDEDKELRYQRQLKRQYLREDLREEENALREKQRLERNAYQEEYRERVNANTQRIQQLRTQHSEQLKELEAQYVKERQRRTDDFTKRINQLDADLLGQRKKLQEYQEKMSTDFKDWLAKMRGQLAGGAGYTATALTPEERRAAGLPVTTGGGSGGGGGGGRGRAEGGYANRTGMYMLAEGRGRLAGPEFILNAQTTRAVEAMVGGQLNQNNIMGALGGRGGIYIDIGGVSSSGSPEVVARAAADRVYGELYEVLRRMEGQ